MLYLYFDVVEQLGVGQVYACLDVSNKIDLKVSLISILSKYFDFSCLLQFDEVENFLSQFTFQHRTTILLKVKLVFSGSQKKKQKTKQFDAKIFIFSSHNYLNQDLYCATKIETYISDIVSVKLPFFSQNLNSFFLNGSCKDLL